VLRRNFTGPILKLPWEIAKNRSEYPTAYKSQKVLARRGVDHGILCVFHLASSSHLRHFFAIDELWTIGVEIP
jgi:hypothetical protein